MLAPGLTRFNLGVSAVANKQTSRKAARFKACIEHENQGLIKLFDELNINFNLHKALSEFGLTELYEVSGPWHNMYPQLC